MTVQGARAGQCLLSLPSSTTALRDPQRDPQFTHPQQGLRGEPLTPPQHVPPSSHLPWELAGLCSSSPRGGDCPGAQLCGTGLRGSRGARGGVQGGFQGGVQGVATVPHLFCSTCEQRAGLQPPILGRTALSPATLCSHPTLSRQSRQLLHSCPGQPQIPLVLFLLLVSDGIRGRVWSRVQVGRNAGRKTGLLSPKPPRALPGP